MPLLAMILFTPWFGILAWAYWRFPASLPRSAGRRRFDLVLLVLALAASAATTYVGYSDNVGYGGAIWKQVVATLYGYGTFLAVLAGAFVVRKRLFGAG